MEISIDDEGLPISVIIDGKIQYRNLTLLGKSKEWLMDYLAKNNVAVKDIIYGYVNEKSKKMYINRRSDEPD